MKSTALEVPSLIPLQFELAACHNRPKNNASLRLIYSPLTPALSRQEIVQLLRSVLARICGGLAKAVQRQDVLRKDNESDLALGASQAMAMKPTQVAVAFRIGKCSFDHGASLPVLGFGLGVFHLLSLRIQNLLALQSFDRAALARVPYALYSQGTALAVLRRAMIAMFDYVLILTASLAFFTTTI